MAYRALELLNLPPGQPCYLLDIGCGSGLSGEILEEEGHVWVGMDIAPAMLGMYEWCGCVSLWFNVVSDDVSYTINYRCGEGEGG